MTAKPLCCWWYYKIHISPKLFIASRSVITTMQKNKQKMILFAECMLKRKRHEFTFNVWALGGKKNFWKAFVQEAYRKWLLLIRTVWQEIFANQNFCHSRLENLHPLSAIWTGEAISSKFTKEQASMGIASIEPQEAAASLFYCVIMHAPSHKYLIHACVATLHLMAVKKRRTLPCNNWNSHCPQSGVDAWVTMYKIMVELTPNLHRVPCVCILLPPCTEILATPWRCCCLQGATLQQTAWEWSRDWEAAFHCGHHRM